jgi:alanine dehydrogenase
MLHHGTRPLHIQRLVEGGNHAISMVSIFNNLNIRMVENMKALAWNGWETAFDQLEQRWPGLIKPARHPINTLILGTGMVGNYAINSATKMGDVERNKEHIASAGPGTVAMSVGRNLSTHAEAMNSFFT